MSGGAVAAWVKLTREPTISGILGTRFGKDFTFDMKVNDAKVHGDIESKALIVEPEEVRRQDQMPAAGDR